MRRRTIPVHDVEAVLGELATGRVGRRLHTEALIRPNWVKGDFERSEIVYDTQTPVYDLAAPDLPLLDRFVRLVEASDGEIVSFAQKYGVLSLRAFRQPGGYAEPIESWRVMAQAARATLQLAVAIYDNRSTRRQDWACLRGWYYERWRDVLSKNLSQPEIRAAAERNQLEDVVNRWIEWAEISPCFSWTRRSGGVDAQVGITNCRGAFGGSLTLRGALAYQLFLAVAQSRALATCSSCGRVYAPKRKPAETRNRYCDTCGINAARRDAQARFRARHGTKAKDGQARTSGGTP